MLKRDSRTSLSVAEAAAVLVRLALSPKEKCTKQLVQIAEELLRFRSSPQVIDPFSAASALLLKRLRANS